MINKKNILIVIILLLFCFVTSCSNDSDEPVGIKVTYELNGGIFQNCTLPIKQYYQYEENQKRLIYSPDKFVENDSVSKTGYTLEGWYKDEALTSKWNFETDTITEEGITLYAKWVKNITYTYNVCYYNENNERVVINSYKVNAGDVFNDRRNFAANRDGYTPMKYVDAKGNDWDFSFPHPGGDSDLAIDVFVEYIKGEYSLVSTKEEFIEAVSKGNNIYLLNDIDLENEEIDFGNLYNYEFIGRNFTVSNFVVNKKVMYAQDTSVDHLNSESHCAYISLFGNVEKSKIVDVNFENVKFKISVKPERAKTIYIAPLAISIIDSNIENVTFNGTYECLQLPVSFNEETNLVELEREFIIETKNSITNNNLVNLEKENK